VAVPDQVTGVFAAGAAGYLTKDHDVAELANGIRVVAAGQDFCSPELAFAIAQDMRPGRPRLSKQEMRILLGYAAGLTLDAAARRAGIRPATAKHYLERVKQKYRSAGRPTYTKLDLAARVREDGLLRHTPISGNSDASNGPLPIAGQPI
jgi:DNA-binding NarL/FixJ family response regulator